MRTLENVVGVRNEDGIHIGNIVDAFIENDTGHLSGIYVQLLGTPARFVFYHIMPEQDQIKEHFVVLGPLHLPVYRTPKFFEIPTPNQNFMSLRGREVYNEDKDFLGILDDFTIQGKELMLKKIFTTGGQIITVEDGEYYIDQYKTKKHLVIQVEQIMQMDQQANGILHKGVAIPNSYPSNKINYQFPQYQQSDQFKEYCFDLEVNHV